MARNASPWYWERRNCWAVIISGQRHLLGDHPDNAPPPHKRKGKWVVPPAIQQRYHEVVAAPREQRHLAPEPEPEPTVAVAEVFEKFLDWCSKNRAPRTYEWSRTHIQNFVNALKGRKIVPSEFAAEDLRPFHVNEWVPLVGDTCARMSTCSVPRWGDGLPSRSQLTARAIVGTAIVTGVGTRRARRVSSWCRP